MIKVAFLIGLAGACRTNELVKMSSASGTKESMKMCAELSGRATGDVAVEMDGKDMSFSFHNCENIEINVQK